jgi:predicted RNase H-like nuclease (RuvC/YqgF family)
LTVQKIRQTKSPAETLAEQLTEKRKEVAELERKLEEAIKAEKENGLHSQSSHT